MKYIFLLFPFFTFAQTPAIEAISKPYQTILTESREPKTGATETGTQFIQVVNARCVTTYYFKDSVCNAVLLCPVTQDDFRYYKQALDSALTKTETGWIFKDIEIREIDIDDSNFFIIE